MAFNLRNRSFVKELDFTPKEWKFLLDLAALSFLGVGVQPPTPDWGAMINQSQAAVLQGQPLSSIVPAVAVVLVVVAFNVVGENVGDRLAGRNS